MKKTLYIFGLTLLLTGTVRSQGVDLSSVKILCSDSSLLVNNLDTSYIFNAYVLTQELSGITTVTLICQDLSPNSTWNTVQDTVYTWNNVVQDSLTNQQYDISKANDNMLVVCLGRLYYQTRHKFIFIVNGSNGLLTREFIF